MSACSGIRYLLYDDIVLLNGALIETQTPDEPVGVISESMLASSQQSPAQYHSYEQCNDMAQLAAVLAASLAQNHPFMNANKRTAAMAALTFLILNGWECTGPEDELLDLIMAIVKKTANRDALANWFRDWCRPFQTGLLNEADADEVVNAIGQHLAE